MAVVLLLVVVCVECMVGRVGGVGDRDVGDDDGGGDNVCCVGDVNGIDRGMAVVVDECADRDYDIAADVVDDVADVDACMCEVDVACGCITECGYDGINGGVWQWC